MSGLFSTMLESLVLNLMAVDGAALYSDAWVGSLIDDGYTWPRSRVMNDEFGWWYFFLKKLWIYLPDSWILLY